MDPEARDRERADVRDVDVRQVRLLVIIGSLPGAEPVREVLVRVGGDWESGGKWVPLMCDEATAARVTES